MASRKSRTRVEGASGVPAHAYSSLLMSTGGPEQEYATRLAAWTQECVHSPDPRAVDVNGDPLTEEGLDSGLEPEGTELQVDLMASEVLVPVFEAADSGTSVTVADCRWSMLVPPGAIYDSLNPVYVRLGFIFQAPVEAKASLYFSILLPSELAAMAALAGTGKAFLVATKLDELAGSWITVKVPWKGLDKRLNELVEANYFDLG